MCGAAGTGGNSEPEIYGQQSQEYGGWQGKPSDCFRYQSCAGGGADTAESGRCVSVWNRKNAGNFQKQPVRMKGESYETFKNGVL